MRYLLYENYINAKGTNATDRKYFMRPISLNYELFDRKYLISL